MFLPGWSHSSRVHRLALLAATFLTAWLGAPASSAAQAPPFGLLAPCTAPLPATDGWPVAGTDTLTSGGGAITFPASALVANDAGTALTILSVGPNSSGGGRITGSGPYTFTPAAGFALAGSDVFTYRVSDAAGQDTIGVVMVRLGDIPVPDLSGTTESAASAAIAGAGLTVGAITTANSATVPAGLVSSQAPAAGTTVAALAAVDFTVSLGPASVTVPAIVGLTQAAAQLALANAGLTAGAITSANTESVPAGQVVAQTPAALSSVPPNTAVSFVLSLGPATVTVPSVIGMTQLAAQNAIASAGLTTGAIASVNSQTVPAGQVLGQVPAAGASVAPSTAVALTLSAGPPLAVVPNVVGLAQAAAQAAIGSAGLSVGAVTSASSATVPAGQVSSQTPAAGLTAAPGSAVALVISLGPAAGSVPAAAGTVWSDGGGTRTTPAFSTPGGAVLVAFAASDGPAAVNAQTLTISGGGLTWTRIKRAATRFGAAEIWTASAAAPLTNVTVTSRQSAGGFQQSLTVVAFTGVGGIGASAVAGAVSGAPAVSLVTEAAGSLVYGVGNDWDRAVARTLPAGQSKVHEFVNTAVGDSFWVQSVNGPIAAGGTLVSVTATGPTNDQWNFAAVELKPAGAPAPTVTVPNVVGLSQSAAQGAIANASLTVGAISSATSATVPAGQVISQAPAAGASVAPNSAVGLVVSSGAGACTAAPGAPAGLSVSVAGRTLTFAWNAPAGAANNAPASYLFQAGLTPGTTIQSLPLSGTGTTYVRSNSPAGTYFVRIRGVNGCGTGPASNEVTVVVQ